MSQNQPAGKDAGEFTTKLWNPSKKRQAPHRPRLVAAMAAANEVARVMAEAAALVQETWKDMAGGLGAPKRWNCRSLCFVGPFSCNVSFWHGWGCRFYEWFVSFPQNSMIFMMQWYMWYKKSNAVKSQTFTEYVAVAMIEIWRGTSNAMFNISQSLLCFLRIDQRVDSNRQGPYPLYISLYFLAHLQDFKKTNITSRGLLLSVIYIFVSTDLPHNELFLFSPQKLLVRIHSWSLSGKNCGFIHYRCTFRWGRGCWLSISQEVT